MQKKQRPPAPELKALVASLRNKASPKHGLQKRAAALVADAIVRIQRQSRLKG